MNVQAAFCDCANDYGLHATHLSDAIRSREPRNEAELTVGHDVGDGAVCEYLYVTRLCPTVYLKECIQGSCVDVHAPY